MPRPQFTLRRMVVGVAVAALLTWRLTVLVKEERRAWIAAILGHLRDAAWNRRFEVELIQMAKVQTDRESAADLINEATTHGKQAAIQEEFVKAARRRYGLKPD
jgi:hypothetical protein